MKKKIVVYLLLLSIFISTFTPFEISLAKEGKRSSSIKYKDTFQIDEEEDKPIEVTLTINKEIENTEIPKMDNNEETIKKPEPRKSVFFRSNSVFVGNSLDKNNKIIKTQNDELDGFEMSDETIPEAVGAGRTPGYGDIYQDSHFKWNGNTITGLSQSGKQLVGSARVISIPARATDIADFAFFNKGISADLVFERGSRLTRIGKGAFIGNYVTTASRSRGTNGSIIFPESISEIGEMAFIGNNNSDEIDDNQEVKILTNSTNLTIGQNAFAHGLPSKAKITIGKTSPIDTRNTNITIGDGAFFQGDLTFNLNVNGSTRVINFKAKENPVDKILFFEDYEQNNLNISIGKRAFMDLGLVQLHFSPNITTIGEEAFKNNDIYGSFPNLSTTYNPENSNIVSKLTTIGNQAFFNAGFTENLILGGRPNSTAAPSISTQAFFPNLSEIGEKAFMNNKFKGSLILYGLPITEIKDLTFYGGYGMNELKESPYFEDDLCVTNLPNLKTIGSKVFTHNLRKDENGSNEITLSQTRALEKNYGFERAIVSLENLETIGSHTFQDNRFKFFAGFESMKNLREIKPFAFSNSEITHEIIFPEGNNLQAIREGAFFNTYIKGLNFSSLKNLQTIDRIAFAGARFSGGEKAKDIEIVDLPNLQNIGESAFQETGTINAEVSGKVNYSGPVNVKLSKLPKLTNIPRQLFFDSTLGGTIEISNLNSLQNISEHAFAMTLNQQDERLNGNEKNDNDIGFTKLKIAEAPSLKTIGKSAFINNKLTGTLDLSSLKSLESLGEFAMAWNGFTCVDLPDSTTSIGPDENHAFSLNNQDFKGVGDETGPFFNLPIFAKNVVAPKSDDYDIGTEGSCKTINAKKVEVKISTDTENITGKDSRLDNFVIKLKNPDGNFENGSDTKGSNKNFNINTPDNTDWDVVIDKSQIPEKDLEIFDLTDLAPYEEGKEIPEFENKVSKVDITLKYKTPKLTIKYIDKDTGKEIKKADTSDIPFENGKVPYSTLINGKWVMPHTVGSAPIIKGYNFIPPSNDNKKIYPENEVSFDLIKGIIKNLQPGENTLNLYYENAGKNITITKISDHDSRPMPCIEYAVYKYNKTTGEKGALITKMVTDENGKASINITSDVLIEEIGMKVGCYCNDKPCPKDFPDYVPNKKPTPVEFDKIPDGSNIEYKGYQVSFIVPETGTLGILPFVAIFLVLGFVYFYLSRNKREKGEK